MCECVCMGVTCIRMASNNSVLGGELIAFFVIYLEKVCPKQIDCAAPTSFFVVEKDFFSFIIFRWILIRIHFNVIGADVLFFHESPRICCLLEGDKASKHILPFFANKIKNKEKECKILNKTGRIQQHCHRNASPFLQMS